MKTIDFRSFERLMVVRDSRDTPSDADWDAFLDGLDRYRTEFDTLRVVVFTEGGGPNADQRKRLKHTLGGASFPVAVITESVKVRFIATSIALINRYLCSYAPEEVHKAYDFLKLDARDRRRVDEALVEMGRGVG
jgi:hypothetical protein